MRVLLDTATFLWAAQSPEQLSRAALAVLRSVETERELSSLSISEIAIKNTLGKLEFDLKNVLRSLDDLIVRVLPYRAEHALELFSLPRHHADPFDRQIIAQALAEDLPVVTSDRSFRLYKGVKVIW